MSKERFDEYGNVVLPMKWHNFLKVFLFIIGALGILGAIVSALGKSVYSKIEGSNITDITKEVYENWSSLRTVDIAFALISVICCILFMIAGYKLTKFKPEAPKFLIMVFVISAVTNLLHEVCKTFVCDYGEFAKMQGGSSGALLVAAIGGFIVNIIFIALNVAYYKNRADMFKDDN